MLRHAHAGSHMESSLIDAVEMSWSGLLRAHSDARMHLWVIEAPFNVKAVAEARRNVRIP